MVNLGEVIKYERMEKWNVRAILAVDFFYNSNVLQFCNHWKNSFAYDMNKLLFCCCAVTLYVPNLNFKFDHEKNPFKGIPIKKANWNFIYFDAFIHWKEVHAMNNSYEIMLWIFYCWKQIKCTKCVPFSSFSWDDIYSKLLRFS